MSAPEQQAVLAKQLADVTPAVRFCQYQMGKEGPAGSRGASSGTEAASADDDALQVPPQVPNFLVFWACTVCYAGARPSAWASQRFTS